MESTGKTASDWRIALVLTLVLGSLVAALSPGLGPLCGQEGLFVSGP